MPERKSQLLTTRCNSGSSMQQAASRSGSKRRHFCHPKDQPCSAAACSSHKRAEKAKALESADFGRGSKRSSGVTPAEALSCCLLARLLLIWAMALSAARAEGTAPGDGSEGSPWRRLKAHTRDLLGLRWGKLRFNGQRRGSTPEKLTCPRQEPHQEHPQQSNLD